MNAQYINVALNESKMYNKNYDSDLFNDECGITQHYHSIIPYIIQLYENVILSFIRCY